MTRSNRFALIGFLLALPISIVFCAIVFRLETIESGMKMILTSDGSQPNPLGMIVIFGGTLLLPVALIVALWPAIKKGPDGKRRYPLLNLIVAAGILAVMTPTWGGLLNDIYRCDILQEPNCD